VGLKSNFKTDLQKEQKLTVLLDTYYRKHLKHYHFKRISDLKQQLQGIDLIFTHKSPKKEFLIDEKAQLDYINRDLPTFAFELSYQKNGAIKQGWLFDTHKKTDFYALVKAICSDDPNTYTSCKITLVNRKKLISFLENREITENSLKYFVKNAAEKQGKVILKGLDPKAEGYLYFSSQNKVEKPINIILKLEFLIKNGLAKRLV
jgi:hypothetical protein